MMKQTIKHAANQIVIIGVEKQSLEVCDLLCEYGIENICFFSNEPEEENHLIGEFPVLNERRIRQMNKNVAFIDCINEHSAWGCGDVDDYRGYRRNENYFCIKDYIKIRHSNMEHLIQGKDIILVGDILLCKKFYTYLGKEKNCKSIAYYNLLNDKNVCGIDEQIPIISKSEINKTDLFLVCAFETIIISNQNINALEKEIVTYRTYIERLRQEGYFNYVFMSNYIPQSLMIDKGKYTDIRLMPKTIMLGALHGDSGTSLMRQVLVHKKILKMEYGLLNDNLIMFCIMLSGEKSNYIIKLFIILGSCGKHNWSRIYRTGISRSRYI